MEDSSSQRHSQLFEQGDMENLMISADDDSMFDKKDATHSMPLELVTELQAAVSPKGAK